MSCVSKICFLGRQGRPATFTCRYRWLASMPLRHVLGNSTGSPGSGQYHLAHMPLVIILRSRQKGHEMPKAILRKSRRMRPETRQAKKIANWLGTPELAAELGISTRALRRWVALGRFPAPKYVGSGRGRPKWSRGEVDAFLANAPTERAQDVERSRDSNGQYR
jgi:predicted DNA-binding transcriptional regulator AlpA